MSRCFAVIPARGGSKGVPRKNLQLIGGIPLLAIAIRTASGAKSVSEVIVSTDDPDIAKIAESEGATVIHRPAELSGDASSSESVLLHVLEVRPDLQNGLMVFMQCTSPFTLSKDLDEAVQLYHENPADVIFSAVRTHAFLWKNNERGFAVEVNHDRNIRQMRQCIEPQFQETGAFYVLPTRGLMEYRNRFFGNAMLYEIPKNRALDIDDLDDLALAEAILKTQTSGGSRLL